MHGTYNNIVIGDNQWFYRRAGGYDHGGSDYGPCPPPHMCFGGLNWKPQVKLGDASGNVSFSAIKDSAYWIWTYLYVDQDMTLNISNPSVGAGSEGYYINGNYSKSVGTSWPLKAGYNRIDITTYSQSRNFTFNLNNNIANQVSLMNTIQLAIPKIGADFNSDGLTDAGNFDALNGNFEVSLSTTGGFVPKQQWISNFGTNKNVLLGHFDQNGFIDFSAFFHQSI